MITWPGNGSDKQGSIDHLGRITRRRPQAGDVVADVRLCTICGTDLDIVHGGRELPTILMGMNDSAPLGNWGRCNHRSCR